ncbi:Rpn family recombination-promoting nuclease/putative transposase [Faecalicatena faecalis]|uniref:Rpn family recombination-promoting nuclease/putative transposase n=1 Tax=Faecalicatena faecalis TaxID=2726362 RepID=UPI0024848A2D|nr:Rpn family recombination-promoting nuclease/putative transposase [Faecalicatena faecalis]
MTNDYAFRKVFKNPKVTKGFLMAVMELKEEEIVRLEILDLSEAGEMEDEKEGILDIKLHLNDSRKINIELQNRYQEDWSERSLFYNCRMFTEGFLHGNTYGEMEPCIHIGILNFSYMESPGFHHRILLMDDKTKEVYSSKFIFHVIELKKLESTCRDGGDQDLYHWAKMLAATDWEAIYMEARENPYMEAAKDEMEKINQSEMERYLYLRREMAISDEISRIRTATNQGIREGIEKGELLKLIALIRKKYDKGISPAEAAEALEEPVETIQDICHADVVTDDTTIRCEIPLYCNYRKPVGE